MTAAWSRASLGAVAQVRSGVGFPPKMQGRSSGTYPLAKVGDLSRVFRSGATWIDGADNYVDEADLLELRSMPMPVNSILFPKIGESIRLNYRLLTRRPMLVDNNVMAVLPNQDRVDPVFLIRFLQTVDFYKFAIATAVPSIRKTDVEAIEVPLPPLDIQRRIVAKLDTLLAQTRAAREQLEAIPSLVEKYRQSILFQEVTGARIRSTGPAQLRLGEAAVTVPIHWQLTTLGTLVNPSRPICYGIVQPGPDPVDGVPLIRVQDLEDGGVRVSTLRRVSAETDAEYKRSRVVSGDVLVSVVGTIGRAAVVPKGFVGNIARAVARLSLNETVDPSWVLAWLASGPVQWWLNNTSREVARKTLNLGDLERLPVAVPPLSEQATASLRLAAMRSAERTLRSTTESTSTLTATLERALLAKAFRGELVLPDLPHAPMNETSGAPNPGQSMAAEAPPATRRNTPRQRSMMIDSDQ